MSFPIQNQVFAIETFVQRKRGRNFRFYFFSTILWSKSAVYRVVFTKKLYFLTSFFKTFWNVIQGVQFEKFQKQKAVAHKQCISDPVLVLVKPKCVWETVDFLNFQKSSLHFSTVCLQFFKYFSNVRRVKYAPFLSYSLLL